MKKFIYIVFVLVGVNELSLAQAQFAVDKAPSTPTTSSPGFVFGWPAYASQNFLYDGQYLNHYGSGFYSFNDGTSIGGINSYVSSYFGVDLFTAGQRRFRINANGNVIVDQNLTVNNGASISSDFNDTDPGSTWNSNLSVRNNNGTVNTFSRLTFVSQSGGMGTISVQKTSEYTGDMFFQVRNGSGFYQTPIIVKATGNVGIGTLSPTSKLEVSGQTRTGMRQNGTSSDFEALSVFNTTTANLPSGNGAVIQFYNNANNNNGVFGTSIKSASVNNFYGWESDLYLRTTKNNNYSTQTILDAVIIKGGTGNVGIGTTNPGSFKLAVEGKIYGKEVQVALTNPGPDYVFEEDYNLPSLDSIKTYIDKNKHLPEVPSAKEMEANGVNLGEMNMLLLKKIEELTLYVIEQNRKTEVLVRQNERQQKDNAMQQMEIEELKSKIK